MPQRICCGVGNVVQLRLVFSNEWSCEFASIYSMVQMVVEKQREREREKKTVHKVHAQL